MQGAVDRMLKWKSAVVIGALFLPVLAAQAEEPQIIVMGQVGCSYWTAQRNIQRAELLEQWVLGFLDGLSLADKKQFWDKGDPASQWKAVYSAMDGYCAANPDKTVLQGATQFYTWRTHPAGAAD